MQLIFILVDYKIIFINNLLKILLLEEINDKLLIVVLTNNILKGVRRGESFANFQCFFQYHHFKTITAPFPP